MNLRMLPFAIVSISLLTCFSQRVWATDDMLSPRRVHQAGFDDRVTNLEGAVRIVVKTVDGAGIRTRQGEFVHVQEYERSERLARHALDRTAIQRDAARVNTLLNEAGLSVYPLIDDVESEFARLHRTAETYWGHEVAELASYAQLILPAGSDAAKFDVFVQQLNRLAVIEVAYIEPLPQPFDKIKAPPPSEYSCDSEPKPAELGSLTSHQGYLGAPPLGVNALAAHTLPGGQGENVRVIDIEAAMYPHADLPDLFMQAGEMYAEHGKHGTSVVGVIAAKSNNYGTTGIAPKSSVGFRSIYNSNLFDDWDHAMIDQVNVAWNIYWAAKHSMKGVVLIELQRLGPVQKDCPCTALENKCLQTPVEFWPADFDVIQTAVGNGATIIEAAANGGRNLDDPVFWGAFDRKVRDSGAILVTGSMSDGVTPKCHYSSPNHGSRVDLHSWGENVTTTGGYELFNGPGHCYDYRNNFNGSSSASAIIAGVAASLQGAYKHTYGEPADPLSIRKVLTGTGTPQAAGTEDLWIGRHPDLLKAIEQLVD